MSRRVRKGGPAGYNDSIGPISIAPLCFIVADDLTGACDAAVPFATRGYRATVLLDAGQPMPQDGIVAVTTDSRGRQDCDPQAVMKPFRDVHPRILFKKIDSLLRGNAPAEIAAALAVFGCDAAVITPAFPRTGRFVESGLLRVPFLDDLAPVDVAAHFRPCGLDRFCAGDIRSDGDLDAIVAAAPSSARPILWAGSAGLAAALARTLPSLGRGARVRGSAGNVLFAIGSRHFLTVEQQRLLAAARPSSLILPIPCDCLGERLFQARESIGALLLSGGDTAAEVCRAIGARAIELQDEILPGLPAGRLSGGLFDGVAVATKSGAFGPPDALIQVAEYFTCH